MLKSTRFECNFPQVRDIKFAVEDISRALTPEEKGPYQYVFLQECESMNQLVKEMARSLLELQLGFKGELTMSEQMEQLASSLFLEKIPPR
jgi:dynein heavy chain